LRPERSEQMNSIKYNIVNNDKGKTENIRNFQVNRLRTILCQNKGVYFYGKEKQPKCTAQFGYGFSKFSLHPCGG